MVYAHRFTATNPREMHVQGHLTPHSVRNIPCVTGLDPLTTFRHYQIEGDMVDLGWATVTGNIYRRSFSTAWAGRLDPENGPKGNNIYFDGVPGRYVRDFASLSQPKDWTFSSGFLFVVTPGDWPYVEYNDIYISDEYIEYVDITSDVMLEPLRVIYSPEHDVAYQYPMNPHRTINYYQSAVRRFDVTEIKTLSSALNIKDLQEWEEVTIKEIWGATATTLSMLSEFYQTLHLMTVQIQPLGSYVGWCPFDLSFGRHLIDPISLEVGDLDVDIQEIREDLETSLGSYIDRQVTFTFKMVRPQIYAGSSILAEGY